MRCSSLNRQISNVLFFSATIYPSSPCTTTLFSCVVWITQLRVSYNLYSHLSAYYYGHLSANSRAMIPKYPDHSTQSWQEGQKSHPLLHNGIIHRNVLAQRKIPVNHFLLLVRIIIRKQTLEHLRNGRLIYAQAFTTVFTFHTKIPAFQKKLFFWI